MRLTQPVLGGAGELISGDIEYIKGQRNREVSEPLRQAVMVIKPLDSAHVALHSRASSVAKDEFSEGRQVLLEACHSRRSQPPAAPGPEESVAAS